MLAIQSWRGFRRRSVFVNARALVGSDTDLRIRCAIAQKSNHTQHTGNYSDKSQKRFHRVKISAFARLLRKFSPRHGGQAERGGAGGARHAMDFGGVFLSTNAATRPAQMKPTICMNI